MPSGLVAAMAELSATAQNTEPFHATPYQVAETGSVRWVQVMPSGLVAAMADPAATTQNTEPFHAMLYVSLEIGKVLDKNAGFCATINADLLLLLHINRATVVCTNFFWFSIGFAITLKLREQVHIERL
jgi:hypothetical protein